MSLLEIVKPAAQCRIQFDDNFRQTIPARALGPHPDAIVHGLKTLAPHPASPHFEVIAQKVKALPPLPTVSHVGLLGVKTQPIDLYPGFYLRKRRLGFFSTSAQHHKGIRVSHHPIALLHHLTIQAMKVDVGQKRTDHRALRCAAARPPFLHVLDDVLMQIGLDQLKHPAIAHTLLYALHKPRMRNRVEVAPQVGIHHKGVALSKQSVHFAKRLFAAKTRAKAITHLQELPLKDGYTLSIRLNHLPPLTPFSSAANMRSFHTEASTHDQSLLWASAPWLATSRHSRRFAFALLRSETHASTFLSSLPSERFCFPPLSRLSPQPYYGDSDSCAAHRRHRSPRLLRHTFLSFRLQPRGLPGHRFTHHASVTSEFRTSP